MFTDEIRRVKTADLHDGNGIPVLLKWFNNGSNGSEYVYVGSSFAVFAGTLVRKNPAEGEFFRLDAFILLKCAINKRDLPVIDHLEESFNSNTCQSTSSDCMKDGVDVDSTVESLDCQEESTSPSSAESLPSPDSPPRTKSPPKCSTPRTEIPPQFHVHNGSSSLDDSLKSDSSVSEISANPTYAPATKKRKT